MHKWLSLPSLHMSLTFLKFSALCNTYIDINKVSPLLLYIGFMKLELLSTWKAIFR